MTPNNETQRMYLCGTCLRFSRGAKGARNHKKVCHDGKFVGYLFICCQRDCSLGLQPETKVRNFEAKHRDHLTYLGNKRLGQPHHPDDVRTALRVYLCAKREIVSHRGVVSIQVDDPLLAKLSGGCEGDSRIERSNEDDQLPILLASPEVDFFVDLDCSNDSETPNIPGKRKSSHTSTPLPAPPRKVPRVAGKNIFSLMTEGHTALCDKSTNTKQLPELISASTNTQLMHTLVSTGTSTDTPELVEQSVNTDFSSLQLRQIISDLKSSLESGLAYLASLEKNLQTVSHVGRDQWDNTSEEDVDDSFSCLFQNF